MPGLATIPKRRDFLLATAKWQRCAVPGLVLQLLNRGDDAPPRLGITASRKIGRVQTEIRKLVEKNLRENHGWDESEVSRNLSETAERLGMNMETLFGVLFITLLLQEAFRGIVL